MTKYQSSWWRSMVEKHGSKEAVHEVMRQRQSKSRENYTGGGGFRYLKKTDPDKLEAISRKGGRHGKTKGRSTVKKTS
jgi:restriction endonuclease Mrr